MFDLIKKLKSIILCSCILSLFTACVISKPAIKKINTAKYIRPLQKLKEINFTHFDKLFYPEVEKLELDLPSEDLVEDFEYVPVKQIERAEQRKVLNVKISSDGKYAIIINSFQISRISLQTLKEEKVIDHRRIVDGGFTGIDVSSDGKWIVGGSSWDTRAHLYDWNGNPINSFNCKEKNSYVEDVSFSSDGKKILLSCLQFGKSKKNFLLYDREGNFLFTQKVPHLYSEFASDGKNVLTYEGEEISYWDKNGKEVKNWKFGMNIVSLAFSNSSDMMLIANPEEWILFKYESNKTYSSEKVQTEKSAFIADYYKITPEYKAFHQLVANDKLVLSGGRGGAYLWNLKGKLLKFFPGHEKNVTGVALSGDEDTMVTASADRTIIWKKKKAKD
jgi:WD40 repeat protein